MERQKDLMKMTDCSLKQEVPHAAFRDWFQVDGDLDDFIFYFENTSQSSDR